jgi:hypothetical protein
MRLRCDRTALGGTVGVSLREEATCLVCPAVRLVTYPRAHAP